MSYRSLFVLLTLLGLAFVVACSSGPAPSTSVPTAVATVAIPPTQAVVSSSSSVSSVASSAASTAAPTVAPTQTAAPTATTATKPSSAASSSAASSSSKAASSGSSTFGKADLDKIFPPGKGQDLVFRACVNCHNWVPLVLAGFDPNAWDQNMMNHRNRVSGLSDDEFNFLYTYLKGNFYPGKPPPTNIPKDLLDTWTSY